MIRPVNAALLTVAAVATVYAAASWLARMPNEATPPAIVAILTLGAYFVANHIEHERRRAMAEYRRAQWERRFRGLGL